EEQDDIDILALNKKGDEVIFCECKFRNQPIPMGEYEDLMRAAEIFPSVRKKYMMFFIKGGYTKSVVERAAKEGVIRLGINELFELR
ncbi:DUF234 domain-containing protein, partial [Treponema pedis]|uniref:DUF234 domain-containing protein n=1 Tax=Treponema pedis TaxID=409322 RepID=UPI000494487B